MYNFFTDDLNDLMIHYPDVDNAIHSHLGVGDDRGARTAIHLPLWSDVGGANGGTGAGLAAAVSGKTKNILLDSILLCTHYNIVFIASIFFSCKLKCHKGDGSNMGVLGLPSISGLGNSHVTPNHPLLMGRQVNPASQTGSEPGAARGVAAGGQRTLQRHRGFRGYINLNSRGQTGNPTAPAVLQNFLGSNPQDLITQGLRRGTPLLVDFGFAILDSLENEIPDLSDGVIGARALSTIPSALVRWNEESRVIDGDSMHDCVTALKPAILDMVIKTREEELADRKLKKKKSKEEEDGKKKAEEEKCVVVTQPINIEEAPQALELSTSYNVTNSTIERQANPTSLPGELDGPAGIQPPPTHPIAQPIAIHDISNIAPSGTNVTMTEMLTPSQQHEQALRSAFQSITSSSADTSPSIINVEPTSLDTGSARTTVQYQPSIVSASETNTCHDASLSNPVLTSNSTSTEGIINPSVVPPLPFSFQQPPAFAALLGQTDSSASGMIIPPPPLPMHQTHSQSQNFSRTEINTSSPHLAVLAPSHASLSGQEALAATNSSDELDVIMTSSEPSIATASQPTGSWQNRTNNALRTSGNDATVIANIETLPQNVARRYGNIDAESISNIITLNSIDQDLMQANNVVDRSRAILPQRDPVPGPSGMTAQLSSGENIASGIREDFSSELGMNISDLPEGVDPSFLAALPEDMRQEVIDEQRRLQTIRQRAAQNTEAGVSEVNPEFLAALPPNIQEEVLAQQRMEQQRQAATAANPEEPVDPGEFLQTLPAQLRQSVLADMEESQIPSLPAEYAAEAQTLRREIEQRNRAMMHERFFSHVNHSGSALSSILRNTVNRIGNLHFMGYIKLFKFYQWKGLAILGLIINFLI